MSFQQNRGNYRATQRNSNNDGQTGAKRKKGRWTRARENEMALKRERRSESDNFGIDTPLFKTPFPPQRSPNPRSRGQSFNYDEDRYNYNDQPYNHDNRYDNYDSPSYDRQRSLASPGRNMRDAHLSSPGQQKRSQFETRGRQQFVEPQHSGPAWYWEKYLNEIHNWQDKHKLSYYKSRCMALEFENQMLFEQVKSLIEENSVIAAERGEVPTMLLPNFPGRLNGFEADNTAGEKPSAAKTPKDKGKNRKSSDESLIFDVPDTMIAVIEKSMRHKLNLLLEEKEKNKTDKEKGADQDKKEVEIKNEGPKEPRGFKRKEELEQLYGENAELIQNLETTIQHDFNRSCDTHNPQMWMDTPLNPEAVA